MSSSSVKSQDVAHDREVDILANDLEKAVIKGEGDDVKKVKEEIEVKEEPSEHFQVDYVDGYAGWAFRLLKQKPGVTVYAVSKIPSKLLKMKIPVGKTFRFGNKGEEYQGVAFDGGSEKTSFYLTGTSMNLSSTPHRFTLDDENLPDHDELFGIDPKTKMSRRTHPLYYHWNKCVEIHAK